MIVPVFAHYRECNSEGKGFSAKGGNRKVASGIDELDVKCGAKRMR